MKRNEIDENRTDKLLERGIDSIYPSREALEKAFTKGRRLRIYHGIDPTGPHLHLGHLTNLLILKRLQESGHEIILVVGDFTAQIGDPTDKLSPRQPLTSKQIKLNVGTFKRQAGRIVSFSGANKAKIKFNSKWLAKMTFPELIQLSQNVTVQQLIQRDMFQERIKQEKPIGLHEFLYPLMQGYDSVAMDVDLEIGGTDQTFNMLIGRDLLKTYRKKEKFVITTSLLVHPETKKKLMNKSEGGLINLDDSPGEMFGKVMALDDRAIPPVAEFSTEMGIDRVRELTKELESGTVNPRDLKLEVASAVVDTVYGLGSSEGAKEEFLKVFSKKEKPTEMQLVTLGDREPTLIELLVKTGMAKSNSEARRLIEQGGVRISDERKTSPGETISLENEIVLQVGPRRFVRVVRTK